MASLIPSPEKHSLHPFRSLLITLCLLLLSWTGLAGGLLSWALAVEHENTSTLLQLKAEMLADHIQNLQDWIGGHGGLYIRVGGDILPNPLLESLPERDFTTPTGELVTLYNSSAFLRETFKEFEAKQGTQVRLISAEPINPINLPDSWEQSGLARLDSGANQVFEMTPIDSGADYRLLRPMQLQPRCLKCHSYADATLGRIVGAVSVTLDTESEVAAHNKAERVVIASHLVLWAAGIIALMSIGSWWWILLNRLERSATRDVLTGLYNRQSLMEQFAGEVERAARYGHPLSVLMLDIDHFKCVNDDYGHQAGDAVLKGLSRTLGESVRGTDVIGRYGGEEILIVCPETDAATARELAERIRATVAATPIKADSQAISITVSIGVSSFEKGVDVKALVKQADVALYQAKDSGRNRVCCAP